jgi:hypothetical protein
MKNLPRPHLFAILPLILLTSACATTGDFPSLAKRPYESGGQSSPVAEAPTPASADPSLLTRLEKIVGQAEAAQPAFQSALAKAQIVARSAAGAAPQSESWIAMQMEISNLERYRTPVREAMSDMDGEYRTASMAQKPADAAAIKGAMERVRAVDDVQADAVATLSGLISRR